MVRTSDRPPNGLSVAFLYTSAKNVDQHQSSQHAGFELFDRDENARPALMALEDDG